MCDAQDLWQVLFEFLDKQLTKYKQDILKFVECSYMNNAHIWLNDLHISKVGYLS